MHAYHGITLPLPYVYVVGSLIMIWRSIIFLTNTACSLFLIAIAIVQPHHAILIFALYEIVSLWDSGFWTGSLIGLRTVPQAQQSFTIHGKFWLGKNWRIDYCELYLPKVSLPIFTYTLNVFGICTDCSLFANLFLANSFYTSKQLSQVLCYQASWCYDKVKYSPQEIPQTCFSCFFLIIHSSMAKYVFLHLGISYRHVYSCLFQIIMKFRFCIACIHRVMTNTR